jgi:hypothetical protein
VARRRAALQGLGDVGGRVAHNAEVDGLESRRVQRREERRDGWRRESCRVPTGQPLSESSLPVDSTPTRGRGWAVTLRVALAREDAEQGGTKFVAR